MTASAGLNAGYTEYVARSRALLRQLADTVQDRIGVEAVQHGGCDKDFILGTFVPYDTRVVVNRSSSNCGCSKPIATRPHLTCGQKLCSGVPCCLPIYKVALPIPAGLTAPKAADEKALCPCGKIQTSNLHDTPDMPPQRLILTPIYVRLETYSFPEGSRRFGCIDNTHFSKLYTVSQASTDAERSVATGKAVKAKLVIAQPERWFHALQRRGLQVETLTIPYSVVRSVEVLRYRRGEVHGEVICPAQCCCKHTSWTRPELSIEPRVRYIDKCALCIGFNDWFTPYVSGWILIRYDAALGSSSEVRLNTVKVPLLDSNDVRSFLNSELGKNDEASSLFKGFTNLRQSFSPKLQVMVRKDDGKPTESEEEKNVEEQSERYKRSDDAKVEPGQDEVELAQPEGETNVEERSERQKSSGDNQKAEQGQDDDNKTADSDGERNTRDTINRQKSEVEEPKLTLLDSIAEFINRASHLAKTLKIGAVAHQRVVQSNEQVLNSSMIN